MMDSVVGLDEIRVSHDIDLVHDTKTNWIDNRSEPEMEFEPEVEQMHEQELTNMRVLEWLHDLPADPEETIRTTQDVNQSSSKYITHNNTETKRIAPHGPLCVPEPNIDLLDPGRSTGTSMVMFVQGAGVVLTHTKNFMTKNLKTARETGELDTEGKKAEKNYLLREFLNHILIYQITTPTISLSRTVISHSWNVRPLF